MKTKAYSFIRIIILIGLCYVLMFAACHIVESTDEEVDNNYYSASRSFSEQVSLDQRSQIIIDGINGTIRVRGEENLTFVKIEGEAIVKSESSEDAEYYLEYLDARVSKPTDEIHIKTNQPENSHGRTFIINYYVVVPKDWIVSVNNVNGNVTVEDINNYVQVNLVNENIYLDNIYGNTEAKLTNGKIEADIVLPVNGYCSLNLVNGKINLKIPRSTSANLSAGVVSGTVNISGLSIQNMKSSRTNVSGVLGSGNGNIALNVVNGDISIIGQ